MSNINVIYMKYKIQLSIYNWQNLLMEFLFQPPNLFYRFIHIKILKTDWPMIKK